MSSINYKPLTSKKMSEGSGESKNGDTSFTRFSELTSTVKSTIQEYEFDVGTVDMIKPDERILQDPRLSASKHSCETGCVKWPILFLSLPLPCYALSKISCIKQNEIGVVTHMMGGAHILPAGCHLSGCCTTVRKFDIKQDKIC